MQKKKKWISIELEKPPLKTKVEISYGLVGTRAAVLDSWISEGWLLEFNVWSVKKADNLPKNPIPTHWRYL